MRGKEQQLIYMTNPLRITPAHAGKSLAKQGQIPAEKDHPRSCGEKLLHWVVMSATLGSPPLMRGKGENCREFTTMRRITPAHAGKSTVLFSCRIWGEDHPRSCGEKLQAAFHLQF